jgi:uncharacterized protein (DUF608 family)
MKNLLFILFVGFAGILDAQGVHEFNGSYTGVYNQQIAFPIGGMGAGMFCMEGTGTISHMSIRNSPDMYNEPVMFAALYIKGLGAKVLEGPVPGWKKFGQHSSASGARNKDYGLARFRKASFVARFPFAMVNLDDQRIPLKVSITGWSPFTPTDADNSGLPVGSFEYHLFNPTGKILSGVFSYSAENFMHEGGRLDDNHIYAIKNGFVLAQQGTEKNPWQQGDFSIFTNDQNTTVDHCWFRGDWWDPLTIAWKKISRGDIKAVSPVAQDAPGASLYVPFTLKPGQRKTIRIMFCWHVPHSRLREGPDENPDTPTVNAKGQPSPFYMPWYSNRFKDVQAVAAYWIANYDELKKKTKLFTGAFYNSTLPKEVLEAVAANLTILKSPTVLRQYDGRFWGWEGCYDEAGSCHGTCTHVYNYAQGLCFLFPAMDRSIIETELNEGLDSSGHQNYRQALPIRPGQNDETTPMADGQLGGLMNMYRDWRISGNDKWLKVLYPKARISLDYCIQTWDPDLKGLVSESHFNTYDIAFYGPDGMCTSIYLGALEAMIQMGTYLQEDVSLYQSLLDKGKKAMESQLFNGQYFDQIIQTTGLHQPPQNGHSWPEAKAIFAQEGPPYQYGKGCLSDGVIGAWFARVCGLPDPLDENKVKSHLDAIYTYNFKTDLSDYNNPQRSTFALGNEGGLLLCTWPKGGQLSLPFPYSNEVWTGIEYEVASHLIFEGKVAAGLNIVRTTRKRYDGTIRNPFDEYECGHWYMRAMSSYALLEALTGVRYDAVTKTLFVNSKVGDFTSFLSTDTGFGNVMYKNGNASVMVVYGKIDVQRIHISRS